LKVVLEATESALSDGADPSKLGDELFAFAQTLDSAHSLRRALTEPAVPAEAKSRLLRSLVEGKLDEATIGVIEAAAGRRWSRARDLPDALEQASVAAHVAKADDAGTLDEVEDNLFRFARITQGDPGLRDAFGDATVPVEGKRSLVDALVGDKVGETTKTLFEQAVAGRQRSLPATLALYQRVAAERRDSLVATVWVAAPLDDRHKERLTKALSEQYSRPMHLNVIIDPEILGGVRVAVGDEVLDSTIEARLRYARRRLER
jgi:F-type H+-transporting ATPase subunit delta